MRSGSEVVCNVSRVGNEVGLRAVEAEAVEDGGGDEVVCEVEGEGVYARDHGISLQGVNGVPDVDEDDVVTAIGSTEEEE